MTDDVKGDNPNTPPEPDKGAGEAQTALKAEDVEKIVQSATDKVRTELYQKLKSKDAEIEDLKKSKMSETELRKFKEDQLKAKESELLQKELKLIATDALKDNDLPMEFREFVIAETPELTQSRILSLKAVFQKAVEEKVQNKFKTAGHDPGKGTVPPTAAFTREQIKAMSPEERVEKLAELKEAMARGLIK